ncbi:ATP-binding protein [Sorangium sp. KYC3313]|uniref:ATP-binding protein n=1 Tax=unclassified Sorangium TaxID=2621164 RepID=UPI003F601DB9
MLDDLLIAPMKDAKRRDLLEVLEDRYDERSTVVTIRVPMKRWHEMLANPPAPTRTAIGWSTTHTCSR